MQFQNKDVEKDFRKKVEHIKALIDAPVDDSKYLWDETAKKYAIKIEQIQRVLKDRIMKDEMTKELKNLCADLDTFLAQCANPTFQIALVGTIKAGKSTLINALLNYELASTRVTPETAALTKFRRAEADSLDISFYTEEEWESLWNSVQKVADENPFMEEYTALNAESEKGNWIGAMPKHIVCGSKEMLKQEIEHWTSATSPVHYFVKEVAVGLKDFDLPNGVEIVDTPGLDDNVEFRSDITRHYIDQANAVLVCVKSDKLDVPQMKTINRVLTRSRNQREKVYVVATQIDRLNDPILEEWKRQAVVWVSSLKRNAYYGSREIAEKNLIPVSAYLFTLMEEYKANRLPESDDRYAFDFLPILLKMRIKGSEIDERFDEIQEITNIQLLKTRLQNEVVSKRSEILLKDIADAYERCIGDIQKVMGQKKEEQEILIADSQRDIEDIRKQREEYEAKAKQAQEDQRDLSAFIKEIQKATKDRISEIEASLRRM